MQDFTKEKLHLQNMSEEQAFANAMQDPESKPLTENELSRFVPLSSLEGNMLIERLQSLKRQNKQAVTVRYDADILAYYKAKGKGYQQAMNNALRVCMEAEKGVLHG